MEDIQIKISEKDDFEKIVQMIKENIDLTRKYDEKLCEECEQGIFVVKCGEEIIGCGGLKRITKNTCELAHIVVRKEFRRSGIGKKLIDFLTKKAFGLGFGKVFATVNTKNENTIHFLEDCGLVREGELKHHYGKDRHIYVYAKYKD